MKILIVGGGMTGDAAAKGIREHDADGAITLVGAEPHAPRHSTSTMVQFPSGLVSPYRFRRTVTMRTGMMITAVAGPLSNLILAVLTGGIARSQVAIFHR